MRGLSECVGIVLGLGAGGMFLVMQDYAAAAWAFTSVLWASVARARLS